ncbi:MAG TPA: DUF3592 domain-containing protein [Myxococcaceae bacterium]|nr:DUF3592 domain-containing protein [Myxococcaceae bacterium]
MAKRVLMAVVLMVLGMFLAYGGARALYRAWASARWPEAEGRVLASSVETVPNQRDVRYRPQVRYTWEAGGRRYTSDVLTFAAGSLDTGTRKEAEAYVKRFPEGGPVRLRYSPDEPDVACVECGKAGLADWVLTVGGVALVLFCGSGLADVRRVYRQRQRTRRASLAGGEQA